MYSIQKAFKSDLNTINSLLQHANLPILEASDNTDYFFKAVNDQNEIVGAIGLEIYGNYGLLRSLIVSDNVRNNGIAGDLVNKIENLSALLKLKELYLLTSTADIYFEKKSYKRIQRSNVQAEITQSREFKSICPVSTVIMHKPV